MDLLFQALFMSVVVAAITAYITTKIRQTGLVPKLIDVTDQAKDTLLAVEAASNSLNRSTGEIVNAANTLVQDATDSIAHGAARLEGVANVVEGGVVTSTMCVSAISNLAFGYAMGAAAISVIAICKNVYKSMKRKLDGDEKKESLTEKQIISIMDYMLLAVVIPVLIKEGLGGSTKLWSQMKAVIAWVTTGSSLVRFMMGIFGSDEDDVSQAAEVVENEAARVQNRVETLLEHPGLGYRGDDEKEEERKYAPGDIRNEWDRIERLADDNNREQVRAHVRNLRAASVRDKAKAWWIPVSVMLILIFALTARLVILRRREKRKEVTESHVDPKEFVKAGSVTLKSCKHDTTCPATKYFTSDVLGLTVCNVACGGHHCKHDDTCKPVTKMDGLQRRYIADHYAESVEETLTKARLIKRKLDKNPEMKESFQEDVLKIRLNVQIMEDLYSGKHGTVGQSIISVSKVLRELIELYDSIEQIVLAADNFESGRGPPRIQSKDAKKIHNATNARNRLKRKNFVHSEGDEGIDDVKVQDGEQMAQRKKEILADKYDATSASHVYGPKKQAWADMSDSDTEALRRCTWFQNGHCPGRPQCSLRHPKTWLRPCSIKACPGTCGGFHRRPKQVKEALVNGEKCHVGDVHKSIGIAVVETSSSVTMLNCCAMLNKIIVCEHIFEAGGDHVVFSFRLGDRVLTGQVPKEKGKRVGFDLMAFPLTYKDANFSSIPQLKHSYPVQGEKVCIVAYDTQDMFNSGKTPPIDVGRITNILEVSPFGDGTRYQKVFYNASTVSGNCSAPVTNVHGKVVGFHNARSAAGNIFIGVDSDLVERTVNDSVKDF